MMHSSNTDLWVDMSLLPLNTRVPCSCCSPGDGCATSYKVRIFCLPVASGYSYPADELNVPLKQVIDILKLGKCSKVIEPSH